VSAGVIVDSTCLIVLERINRLDLLRDVYSRVVVPSDVVTEFGQTLDWFEVLYPKDRQMLTSLNERLGAGESAAIALALEMESAIVILDDLDARRYAKKLGLKVIGTVGLIVKAKNAGLISKAQTVLDELQRAGFYLSETVRRKALGIAGEL